MRARNFSTVRRPSGKGLALTLAGALALVVAAQQALVARAELRRADARVTEARREVGALRERLKRIEARPGVAQTALVRALAAESSPPSAVLGDLVALMPAGIRLDHLELAYGPRVEVEAAIVARGVADYDGFLDQISASSRFGALEPGPETRAGELHTTLRLVYRGGSGR
jgi:hypothetical protein